MSLVGDFADLEREVGWSYLLHDEVVDGVDKAISRELGGAFGNLEANRAFRRSLAEGASCEY